jgi:hypothetical protein
VWKIWALARQMSMSFSLWRGRAIFGPGNILSIIFSDAGHKMLLKISVRAESDAARRAPGCWGPGERGKKIGRGFTD